MPPTDRDRAAGWLDRDARQVLHGLFDGLLVHADPRLIRLEESVSFAPQITIPVLYTGYVSEKPSRGEGGCRPPGGWAPEDGAVVVSAGGAGVAEVLALAARAWERLDATGATGGRLMRVFAPLFATDEDRDRLARIAHGRRRRREEFAPDFVDQVQAADLSISQAGYNTCTNVLETRTRAILLPNRAMSDQPIRARRLAQRGLARTLEPEEITPDRLAGEIAGALSGPAPEHDLDLEGARATLEIIEQF